MTQPATQDQTVIEAPMVLRGTHAEVRIDDLVAITVLRQRFVNEEDEHIEAVYSFPCPVDATFLGLDVLLGDKRLTGMISPVPDARETYEEAVTDGDAAILLEQAEPGLYTVNLGNLAPGESAEVRITYGQCLRWDGRRVRYALPTVVAPRYGQPDLEPHQVPEVDLNAEYPFSLDLRIRGQLTGCELDSPTHAVHVQRLDDEVRVLLEGEAHRLDRELVVNMRSDQGQRTGAIAAPDLDGRTAVCLSLALERDDEAPQPHHYRIVLDCSGSMAGDSIAQCRQALDAILTDLKPGDYFSLVRFGSTIDETVPAPTPATPEHIESLRRRARTLDADLGGTEILAGLMQALKPKAPDEIASDVLLITDGEVWDRHEEFAALVNRCKARGARIFSVGVGSAVNESFVHRIAEATGGAATFVTPGEDMAREIHRHFQRIATPELGRLDIAWPGEPVTAIVPERLFAGDTALAWAVLADADDGDCQVRVRFRNGETRRLTVPVVRSGDSEAPSTLARMGAMAQYKRRHDMELAVAYQLLTDQTACVVVEERAEDEKSDGMPTLRQARQMLAAGWGGTSTVMANVVMCLSGPPLTRPSIVRDPGLADLDFCDVVPEEIEASQRTPADLRDALAEYAALVVQLLTDASTPTLRPAGEIPYHNGDEIAGIFGSETWFEDQRALAAVLWAIARILGNDLDRDTARFIRRFRKQQDVDTQAVEAVTQVLKGWLAEAGAESGAT